MFGRLNPTKPPAAHRAALEHVGAACREWREKVSAECGVRSSSEEHVNHEGVTIFAKHGVFRVGVAAEFGGRGVEPLLVAMAAERIGREGLALCGLFARHARCVAILDRWGTTEQKELLLTRAARGETAAVSVAEDEGVRLTGRLAAQLATAAGCVGVLADCLEVSGSQVREFLATQPDHAEQAGCQRFVADLATDVESGRALVYAAAELKAEFDHRPSSKHLEWETVAIVAEAAYLATRAVARLWRSAGELDVGGATLFARFPPWHRVDLDTTVLADEPADSLQSLIANYCLFQ
jgi:alkylation response protein AidB-like acyl-CoA dehydrogenase